MEELDKQALSGLSNSFELSTENLVSKQQILAALSSRISQLLAGNPDQLFSLLYRLDISEKRIKTAMKSDDDVAPHLAALVYERQLEKTASRKRFKQEKPDDDLSW